MKKSIADFDSGNACYQSVHNLSSSRLLSENINIKIHRTVNRPFALYGCKTWCLTLRIKHRLRVSEHAVLRKMFVPKWDEVTVYWCWLHIEELHDLYSSQNIIRVTESRRIRWATHVARMAKRRGAYQILVMQLRERVHLQDPSIDTRINLK